MYKQDYKVWGWVREPGKPWKTARLVMLNEQKTLAPDRAGGRIGSDNNFEYKLTGYFSGQSVYEPASNAHLPGVRPGRRGAEEHVRAQHLRRRKRQIEPNVRILQPPI